MIFYGFLTFILFQTLHSAQTKPHPYDSMTSISATLDVPPTIKELKALGGRLRTASTRLQPAIWEVFFSSCVHRFHRDLYLSRPKQELEVQAKFYEKFSRTSPSSLGFYYLVRFYISLRNKDLFVAQNQGLQVIQSAFVAEMSPPDMEFFLYSLNQVAAETKLPLPGDVRISIEDWFRPPLSQLLEASYDFYLLKTENPQWKLQLENLGKSRKQRENPTSLRLGSIWSTHGFPEELLETPEASDAKANRMHKKGPPSKFYAYLFGSFAWLQKHDPMPQGSPEKTAPLRRLQNRRQRRRRAQDKRLRISLAEDGKPSIIAESILRARTAQKMAQTSLQSYMAYIHLAYLHKLEENPQKNIRSLEASLEFHPTSGTYRKLALYYRSVGDFKRMTLFNSKALALNPDLPPVQGPEPRIQRGKEGNHRNGKKK